MPDILAQGGKARVPAIGNMSAPVNNQPLQNPRKTQRAKAGRARPLSAIQGLLGTWTPVHRRRAGSWPGAV